jgi:hypothetical protein
MSEWPGATIPAKCHDCGRTYFVTSKEHDEPGAVCKDCFDAFEGMTMEELMSDALSVTQESRP